MARMPGAIWRPLADDWASQPRMTAYDFFCLHTMVGGLSGTDDFFRNKNGVGYGGTESHFGVGPDGTIFQWQDTDFQADANADGNWHVISSENADTGAPFPAWGGSDVPAMTPEQVESNARIAVWLYRTHGIPLPLAGSSKPGARGLAVHRYGVPGYMPAGAEQWSTAKYKACPGDRRIAQAPLVSARAFQLLADPNSSGGFLMALTDAQQLELLENTRALVGGVAGLRPAGELYLDVKATRAAAETAAFAVTPGEAGKRAAGVTYAAAASMAGQVAGLQAALSAVADAPSAAVDLDAVFKAAQDGARSIVDNLRVSVEPDDAA